jgi:amidase
LLPAEDEIMQELLLGGSLAAIHQAVLDKKISVREITDWYVDRIDSFGRSTGLNAVHSVSPRALEDARKLDDDLSSGRVRGPLHGTSVFGFKPSVGSVSRAGIVPLVPSQDSPGPLARSVEDTIRLLSVIAGGDGRDSHSVPASLSRRPGTNRRPPNSIRIGVPRRTMTDRADLAGVMPQLEAVLSELSKEGVTIIDPCDLPAAEQLQDVRSSVFRTEFKAALNAFLGENSNPCGIDSIETLIAWNEKNPSTIPYGQSLLIAAAETKGLNDPRYIVDRRRDIVLSRDAGIDGALWFSNADALIAPMGAAAKCTGKAGAPVLAIPVGLDGNKVPFGVTLYASIGQDADLLEIGAAVAAIVGNRVVPKL